MSVSIPIWPHHPMHLSGTARFEWISQTTPPATRTSPRATRTRRSQEAKERPWALGSWRALGAGLEEEAEVRNEGRTQRAAKRNWEKRAQESKPEKKKEKIQTVSHTVVTSLKVFGFLDVTVPQPCCEFLSAPHRPDVHCVHRPSTVAAQDDCGAAQV